ncbi:WD repeat-containing protein [Hysterangium stoloniferum]|nr:WD repeat-containing protein [Hysterangium stoloniferum]
MLSLLNAYTGWPNDVAQVSLARHSLLLYASADTLVVLDARELSLLRILAFWEAFPASYSTKGKLKVVVTDAGLKLIVASMGSQLAFWSVSESAARKSSITTKVHSTLSLGEEVTAADCKSGLLAVGTATTLSVYTLTLQNDIPTWIKKWEAAVPMLSQILFSPSLTHIASISSKHGNLVRLHLTALPQETQTIRHPRPLVRLIWRAPKSHSRPDLTLYTLTSDSTIRIFHPVLDAPQRLQLHSALDPGSFLPSPLTSMPPASFIFPIDRQILLQSIARLTADQQLPTNSTERSVFVNEKDQLKKLEEIRDEEWDLFLRILKDGSIVVRGIANIDRRPPTLLRQFTLFHMPPSTLSVPRPPAQLLMSNLPSLDEKTCVSGSNLRLTTSPPLVSYAFNPLSFFNAEQEGLRRVAINDHENRIDHLEQEEIIEKFVRTPEGTGVAVVRTSGGEAWTFDQQSGNAYLRRVGAWRGKGPVAVFDEGNTTALFDPSRNQLIIQNHSRTTPDIFKLAVPPLTSLFSIPSAQSHTLLIGITQESSIVQIHVPSAPTTETVPTLHSNTSLPLSTPPPFILPVDPTTWPKYAVSTEADVLMSISTDGVLSFWVPGAELGSSPECDRGKWRCTGSVHTLRQDIRMARCSSTKKTVLVVPHPEGEEITIWDSKESQFSTGLEYRRVVSASEPVNDLDWTSNADGQSILAVGYEHEVLLLCQQRMTYFEQEAAWGIVGKVDISQLTPHPICDSVWLTDGSLLIAAGHQMLHFGQAVTPDQNTDNNRSLFEVVATQNGPLVDYHPQMLLQCLLWEKLEYVKGVIVRFAEGLECARSNNEQTLNVKPLFDDGSVQAFSKDLVDRTVKHLETSPVPGLTSNEQAHLIVLIQTTLEVDEQRRALDSNGLRYLISMRSFYILNKRVITPTSTPKGAAPRGRGRERLRYRDMVWAFHSESQEILLSASMAACGGKMVWDDAKALGIYIWMESTESLRSHMETIARNEFMAGDDRDPTRCALYYFALGKVRLVHGLWRQAAWHKEQSVMLKFLGHDFQEPRWKTAALKNAYALLSKQRFAYAAAFFLLGGSLKDAVNVCVKQLNDVQLAIALARIVEHRDDGPVFQDLLKTIIVPLAFKDGNRYLSSWAFWKMNRRDLAVRVLLTPLADLAASLSIDIRINDIGEDLHYDDPSLALLFSQLKSKTLQTAKGTSEIPERTEFNFILQMARVFCRMGCHVLALDLTASWSFERPSLTPSITAKIALDEPTSPHVRSPFNLRARRRASMIIDMDIPSIPSTEPASPAGEGQKPFAVTTSLESSRVPETETKLDSERQKGLGSLMKTAKQDVTVPEFDMNAFF